MINRDLPPPDHPLLENTDEVRSLGDLIDARENPTQDDVAVREIKGDEDDLDIEDALTFPHKKKQPREMTLDDVTDFDGDARTSGANADDAEAEYATREDFVRAMNQTDPDADAGDDEEDYLDGTDLSHAPGIEGTVTGAIRGLGTHLPQDLGRDGFQIIEPEELQGEIHDPRLPEGEGHTFADARLEDPDDPASQRALEDADDDPAADGGRIPTRDPHPVTRDDALDATRQLR